MGSRFGTSCKGKKALPSSPSLAKLRVDLNPYVLGTCDALNPPFTDCEKTEVLVDLGGLGRAFFHAPLFAQG